jgi:hypothetical protein
MGFLNKVFFNIGYFSASNPGAACFFAMMLTLVCTLGFINFQITVRPLLGLIMLRMILKTSGFLSRPDQL